MINVTLEWLAFILLLILCKDNSTKQLHFLTEKSFHDARLQAH